LPEGGLFAIFFWVDLPGINYKSITWRDLSPENTWFMGIAGSESLD
jgi:hypothetical protein